MIRSFADKDTERLFGRQRVRRVQSFERAALRQLVVLHAARGLVDLKGIGRSLEALKRERKGQHAIRITDRWRLCFRWRDGDAYDVEITTTTNPQSVDILTIRSASQRNALI